MTNQLANTDILVVRHAESCVPGTGNCDADISGKLYFQASLCPTALGYVLKTTDYTKTNGNCSTIADKRRFISHIYYVRTYAIAPPTTAMPDGDGIPTLVRSEFDLGGSPATLAHQPPIPLR